MSYEVWTYDAVRARIIDAAETLLIGPADLGPRMVGMGVFEEYRDDYRRGETTRYRRIPTARALAEMEETWTWINQWLCEKDRKLVYDYGFIMCRKGLTLGVWCEKNGWIKRTFERAVNRCCQAIADNLNRKHAIRLTMAVDDMSQNQSETASSKVTSDSRAPVKHTLYHRAADAVPIHIPGTEPEIAKHDVWQRALNRDKIRLHLPEHLHQLLGERGGLLF